ncbi:MAG: hypothetical protein J1E29_06350 [Duncaniella sp.]|nr:hypothetical protein [Duncaniella sp.]
MKREFNEIGENEIRVIRSTRVAAKNLLVKRNINIMENRCPDFLESSDPISAQEGCVNYSMDLPGLSNKIGRVKESQINCADSPLCVRYLGRKSVFPAVQSGWIVIAVAVFVAVLAGILMALWLLV